MHCLETSDVVFGYSRHDPVLDGIDLRVPEGAIYGFLGPNGAGKTTTLRLVLGLLRLQRGSISIFGRSLRTHRREILGRVGSLIESPSLYDHLTATENLVLLQRVYRCPATRVGHVLALVGLRDTGRKKVGHFSLGMKQRLSIAVALLHDPALLILDEPSNGLDPNGMIEVRALLTRLNREEGTTVLISSHLLPEIDRLVTHVGIVRRGRMVFQGALGELRRLERRRVEVSTNDDPRALRILLDEVPDARMGEGRIVMPAMAPQRIAGLNRRLVEGGLEVHALGTAADDLETIFMDLVGS